MDALKQRKSHKILKKRHGCLIIERVTKDLQKKEGKKGEKRQEKASNIIERFTLKKIKKKMTCHKVTNLRTEA